VILAIKPGGRTNAFWEPQRWAETPVRDLTERRVIKVSPDCDLSEALRLLMSQRAHHMVLVTSEDGDLEGILTKTDVLSALNQRSQNGLHSTPGDWEAL
jgi:CBS-domain-containing membrane protein